MENPRARRDGLVMQEVPDELLVYDLRSNKAYCLNRSAASIWKLCDGTNAVTDIRRWFEEAEGTRVAEDVVWMALDQLSESELLDGDVPRRLPGQSRREVLKTVGRASAFALPLIASLVVQSRPLGSLSCDACTSHGQCLNAPGCAPNCNPLGICAPNPVTRSSKA